MPYQPTTNFKDNNGIDLGTKLVTKDYLLTVYESVLESSVATGLSVSPGLWTWGYNLQGQLGDNTSIDRSTPVTTFLGGTNWKQVSTGVGGEFTAAIKTDGTLWCWGRNNQRQVGNNDFTNVSTPVTTFRGGTDWRQVNAGGGHSGAIKTDGTLWMWGTGNRGQLGQNTNVLYPFPGTTFVGGTDWKQVSCGAEHTAAIKTNGTLWVWGLGTNGRLGNNLTNSRSTPVTTFLGGTDWKQVSCGTDHTAAVKIDGTLWLWGNPANGRLGDNTTITDKLTPITTFLGGTNWKEVACGSNYTGAIKTDGTLWLWGNNTYGQLGVGNNTQRITPVTTISGGNDWKLIDAGSNHFAAIKVDGTLWIWGRGSFGQLGGNNSFSNNVPVTTFLSGWNWKQVACGANHTAAIRSNNEI